MVGGSAPPFTLLLAVDDATGQVVSAWFCEHEDARSYFLLIAPWWSIAACPWPSTPIATPCSSTRRDPASCRAHPVQPGHG